MRTLSKACPECGALFGAPVITGPFGAYFNDLDIYCDDCVGKRVARDDRERRAVDLRRRYTELRSRGLVTERLETVSFAKSSPELEALNPEAWKTAREWTERHNLYLWGSVGTGKTFMALCALRRAFQRGRTVAEVTARHFAKTTERFDEHKGLFPEWIRVDVLLVDDIDKTRWSGDRINALWELLDARSAENRRTIVTANVSPANLRELLMSATTQNDISNRSCAAAALDRLNPAIKVEMQGKSLRTNTVEPNP